MPQFKQKHNLLLVRHFVLTIIPVSFCVLTAFSHSKAERSCAVVIIADLPIVETIPVTVVSANMAVLGGIVKDDGGTRVTERGFYVSENQNSTVTGTKITCGAGSGVFSHTLGNLDPMKSYFVAAYAVNSSGTAYGTVRKFPLCPKLVVDADGNLYPTVNFGSQCWLGENLKTTRYGDGTPIPNITSDLQWSSFGAGAYAWYQNNIEWKNIYGALYNWYAASNQRNVCPEGWKVPNWQDMMIAYSILGGGIEICGKQVKSCRTVNTPLGGACATNFHPRWEADPVHYGIDQFGAAVLPAGVRAPFGAFLSLGNVAAFWSTSENAIDPSKAFVGLLFHNQSDADGSYQLKNAGASIRCIKEITTCNSPYAPEAEEITAIEAKLKWIRAGIETAWNIEYGTAGYTKGQGTQIPVVISNPYTLTGLAPGTSYDYYVQALCGAATSDWVGPVRFTTKKSVGDANCDGNVDVLDIITLVNYIMGQNPQPFCFGNADVNTDVQISVLDIIATVNIIMQSGN